MIHLKYSLNVLRTKFKSHEKTQCIISRASSHICGLIMILISAIHSPLLIYTHTPSPCLIPIDTVTQKEL